MCTTPLLGALFNEHRWVIYVCLYVFGLAGLITGLTVVCMIQKLGRMLRGDAPKLQLVARGGEVINTYIDVYVCMFLNY